MDAIIPTLVVGGFFVCSFLYGQYSRHRRLQYWQGIAKLCHLHVVKVFRWVWGLTLQGRAEPLEVWITGSLRSKSGTQIVVMIPGPPGFSEVSIRRESQTPWKTCKIEVGSEAFDKTFFVEGPLGLVLALLDAETRGLLISANDATATAGSRLELVGGELLVETVDSQLPLILPLLLGIGQRFAQPENVERRLAQNATRDPEAGIRLKNLSCLIHEHPRDRGTLRVLRAACSDPSPEVRLRAGRALGAQGRDVLLELAENPEDDAASAQAVSILGHELSFEHTRAILDKARGLRRIQTARICLEAFGRSGDAAAVDALTHVMEEEEGELAAAAARALEATGSPAAEGPLILALQREQMDLRMAAANALARVGSVAAVLPLEEAAVRFWLDFELGRATQQAIAEIHSRLPGASPGQLSLAAAEMGQLSLAQDGAGQLSLATDPAGRLSLGDEGTPKDV